MTARSFQGNGRGRWGSIALLSAFLSLLSPRDGKTMEEVTLIWCLAHCWEGERCSVSFLRSQHSQSCCCARESARIEAGREWIAAAEKKNGPRRERGSKPCFKALLFTPLYPGKLTLLVKRVFCRCCVGRYMQQPPSVRSEREFASGSVFPVRFKAESCWEREILPVC